jgi:pullulanase
VLLLCVGFVVPPLAAIDPPIPAGSVRIHYYRPDSNFTGWTMWTWNASTENQTSWCSTELNWAGTDSYGAYWDVTVNPASGNPAGDLGFIIHNCAQNVKDPGPDMHLNILQNNEAWVISGDNTIYTTQPTPQQILNGVFQEQQAYWLDRYRLAIKPQYFQSSWTYYLNASLSGGLTLGDSGVTGGTSLQLVQGGTLTADELMRYPQLATYAVVRVPTGTQLATIQQFLKGQVAVSAVDSTNTLRYATGIQIGGVLDDLYFYPGKLGVIFNSDDTRSPPIQLKLWAPTAQGVSLEIFNEADDASPADIIPMQQTNGVWVANGNRDWEGKYYLYNVSVYVPGDHAVDSNLTTDPYSIDISVNGTKSRITDLDA